MSVAEGDHALVQAVQVTAGTERLFASALQHHHGDAVVVGPGIELLQQQVRHRQRETVERTRRIERGDADARAVAGHALFEQHRCFIGNGVGAHAFFHCAARFSRNAVTPSTWSAVANRSTKASRSATSAGSETPIIPWITVVSSVSRW
ncbi:hypothetical protein G6F40_014502 [Rhizopus arrhizus]|nr:hypothetical protein G6F40_014502 [Rhizopus arrhizus]